MLTLSRKEIIALFRHLYKTESLQATELYSVYIRLQKEAYLHLSIEELQDIHQIRPTNKDD